MSCTTQDNLTEAQKAKQQSALERLRAMIGKGAAKIILGRSGEFAIAGWSTADREGISDACAYRALANTPEMRRALLRAEAMAGTRMSLAKMIGGVHSHDGGKTWGSHEH